LGRGSNHLSPRFFSHVIASAKLNSIAPIGNETQLVFCRGDVNPYVVSKLLELAPSEALHVGDPAEHNNGHRYISHLGLWKLSLPGATPDHTVEEQLALWLQLLQPKSAAFRELREIGYRPYIDCKAASGSLSLCIDPEILVAIGELNISLSVWLYEQTS